MTIAGKDRLINIEQSGTNAERLALDTSLIKQATEFYETDTTARYKFVSGAWVQVVASGGIAPGYGSGGGGGGSGSGTTFADQVKIVTSGVAVQLPAHAIANGVIVKSLSTNNPSRQTTSVSATLTNSTSGASGATQGYILEPGEAAPYSVSTTLTNTNQIYVNGYAGDIFSIIGS